MARKNKIDWFHADSFGGGMPMTDPGLAAPIAPPAPEAPIAPVTPVAVAPSVPENSGSFTGGGMGDAGYAGNGFGGGYNNGYSGYNNGGYNGYNGYNGGMQMNQYGGAQQQSAPGGFTPMVQPLVLVPYSSPSQPLYHYPDGTLPIGDIDSSKMQQMGIPNAPGMPNNYGMNGFPYVIGDSENLSDIPKLNVKSLILAILSLLFVALCGMGHFAEKLPAGVCAFINITPETGYDIVARIVDYFTTGTFVNLEVEAYVYIAFTVSAALAVNVLIFLFALISIVRKRTALFVKILTAVLLAAMLVVFAMTVFAMNIQSVGYGMYILIGLSLVMFLLAIIEKKKE